MGDEIWWAHTEPYAGKILPVNAGHRLSLQYHHEKDESCYLLAGKLLLLQSDSAHNLSETAISEGHTWRNMPGSVHTIQAIEDTDVLEVSTPQLDDVVRLVDDCGRGGTSARSHHEIPVQNTGYGALRATDEDAGSTSFVPKAEYLLESLRCHDLMDDQRRGGSLMPPNEQQAQAWNGSESLHFVDHADRYDLQLEPFTRVLLERALPRTHEVVLDVGCGSGATTLTAATKAERATGIDLSRPLVELAMRRAQAAAIGNADFIVADAQTHDFAAGTFDLLISQFGLMFFDDPVRAFTNIRRALRPGGRIVFVSWQGLPANEWLTLISDAAARHVEIPEFGGQVRGPGMFSLCDVDETATLLRAAGFEQVECESCIPTILIGGGGSLDESIDFLLGMGMARGLLSLVDPSERADVISAVSADLSNRYEKGIGTRLGAAAWVVAAQV